MSKSKQIPRTPIATRCASLIRAIAVLPTMVTLLTSAFMFGSMTVPAAAAHACYSQYITSDYGVAFKKSQAREKARASWNRKARAATGTNRVSWQTAKGHEWSCTKPALRWKCTGRAYPCVG